LACIGVTAVLVGIYTCAGGLAAVVYTDVVQCTVMIGGCLVVLVMGLVEVGGVSDLRERLAEVEAREAAAMGDTQDTSRNDRTNKIEHAQLILPVDTRTPFPWPAIYFGLALVLSPAYWIGNQAIVQRSFGARSEFEAKASYIWGALLKSVIPLIIAIPGLIALVLFPDLEDGDQAFPQLVNLLLPGGFRGVFVAAFLAALMSSVDSYLNSAATIVCYDFYKRFVNPDVSQVKLLSVGRATTLALVVWAICFAAILTRMSEESGLYAIFQTLMAFFQGPALAVLLLGILWRRATGKAALVALVCGIATSISLYALNQAPVYEALGLPPLFQIQSPFLYFSVWAFLVTFSLAVVLSLFTRPEPAEKMALSVRSIGKGAGA
jgi:SSS family solute:Na+ symporter